MKQSKPSQRESVKLPSIGNKTMDSIYRQSQQIKKQRPLSSKNGLGDLQKRLFSQLQAYEQKSHTMKMQKHMKTKSAKVSNNNNGQSVLTASSCKDISNHHSKLNSISMNNADNSNNSDSMEKIAQCKFLSYQLKVMPQLYSKILQSKKDEVKPLNELIGFNENADLIKGKQDKKLQQKRLSSKYKVSNNVNKTTIQQISKAPLEQTKISARTITQNPKVMSKKQSTSSTQEPTDSFTFAQKQIDSIYQEYLQSQGLQSQPQTSVKELQSINYDLQKCEVDIQQLQKNYSNLIKQLGDLCVRDIE